MPRTDFQSPIQTGDLELADAYAVVAVDLEERPDRAYTVAYVVDSEARAEELACWCYIEDALDEARTEIEDNNDPGLEPLGFYGWLDEVLGWTGNLYIVTQANLTKPVKV